MVSLHGPVFISFEPVDGLETALWLADRFSESSPPVPNWIADRDILDLDTALDEVNSAIQKCSCFVLLTTSAATAQNSRAAREWQLALKYKKAIIVAMTEDCELPPHLARRPQVVVKPSRPGTFEPLRAIVVGTVTVEGLLATAQHYKADAEIAKMYAQGGARARIDAEIDLLNRNIASLMEVLSDPEGVRDRLDRRIQLGVERLRTPHETSRKGNKTYFVNTPPIDVPPYFQNRLVETKVMAGFLRSDGGRLLIVSGRGGIGKSAFVCRVLRSLEQHQLPDNHGELRVAGVIYLSFIRQKIPNFSNLVEGLAQLLPEERRQQLLARFESAQMPLPMKVEELLSAFSTAVASEPAVILLDNMEDVIDGVSHRIRDTEIVEFLSKLIDRVGSRIKVVLTSRISPVDFASASPAVRVYLPLDEGLASPFAENVFRALDETGALGLRDAGDDLLGRLRELTRGYPRAIEAVQMILVGDRLTKIADLLDSPIPDDRVVQALVSEAFSRLDFNDQLVMEALAVFDEPVPSTAIDYVLRPWLPYIDAALSLRRLANTSFVRREGRVYFQHPVDRQHALRVLDIRSTEEKMANDHDGYKPPGSRDISLKNLQTEAANYYRDIRVPRTKWITLDDVASYVSEFNLRLGLEDDESATEILGTISEFLDKRGAFQQLLTLSRALNDRAQASQSHQLSLRKMSHALWRMGRIDEALSAQGRLIEELDLDPQADPHGKVLQRCNFIIFEKARGEYKKALIELEMMSELFYARPWEIGNITVTLDHIGELYEKLGYYHRAIEMRRRALETARELDNPDTIEAQTHNFANALSAASRVDEALALYQEALERANETHNPLWRANHLSSIAKIQREMGNCVEAARLMDEAIEIRKNIGNLSGLLYNYRQQGEWALLDGNIPEAERIAINVNSLSVGLNKGEYESHFLFARVKAAQGDWVEAERLGRLALETHTDEGTWARRNLVAIAALQQGKTSIARTTFEKARSETTEWLKRSYRNYSAFAHKALSSVGLDILGGNELCIAISSYRRARKIRGLRGSLALHLWWLDLLAARLSADDLTRVREALGEIVPRLDIPAESEKLVEQKESESMPLLQPPKSGELPNSVKEAVVDMLARLAAAENTGPVAYFRNLVLRADLPEREKRKKISFSGNPEYDARALVNGLLALGTNPNDENNALGTVLFALLPDLYLEDSVFTASIMVCYQLLKAPSQLTDVQLRFQIPTALVVPDREFPRGMKLDWVGPTDEVTLQSWLRPEPNLLDVAFLRNAIDCARSVCRIEVGATGEYGTGVLVGRDLVLTSFHVMARQTNELQANVRTARLRFGAYTNHDLSADDGQLVSLAEEHPVVVASPVNGYDFVLLRTSEDITATRDVKKAAIACQTPEDGTALHILQHPNGGSMKLAISDDGVTWAHPESGRVQYVTRTSGGSSGAPCFDARWHVVALHRAEIATSFGSKRQGTLVGSFYSQIEQHLN